MSDNENPKPDSWRCFRCFSLFFAHSDASKHVDQTGHKVRIVDEGWHEDQRAYEMYLRGR